MNLDQNEKDEIAASLHNEYNPTAVGSIQGYPPHGAYSVSIYFDNFNKIETRYHTGPRNAYHFILENVFKSGSEHIANVRIEAVED